MQKIFNLFSVLLFCLILVFYCLENRVIAAGNPILSNLVISEIQTGGCTAYDELNQCIGEDTNMEFVELYNPLSTELQVHNWKIQYISASGATTTTLVTLDGKILPQSYVLLSHHGYLTSQADLFFTNSLAKSGGHVRIADDSSQVIDLVGWGTASATGSWPKVSEIAAGFSTKRVFPGDPLDGIGVIFTPSTLPLTPESGGYVVNLPPGDGGGDDGGGGSGSAPPSSCDGLIISELLPNPAGSDTGREFIELFNPTDGIIPLTGCKLQTTDSSKMFEFAGEELEPGQYKAFYNSDTGLTLTNSGGGSVYLIDTDDTEIYQADYAAGLDDDVSWSLIEGSWAKTFSVTPNAANKLLTMKPCPAGQFRNTDTNRCNNIVSEAAGLGPCPAGKTRNPATNRCRNILSLASALKACAPDQFRNPETNRCKKTLSAGSLKPCNPGQKRNPDTNRCRKDSASSSSNGITDVKDVLSASSPASKISWLMAGGGVLGALSYGVWEWRNELSQKLAGIKNKFL